jgi:hypothetical protein
MAEYRTPPDAQTPDDQERRTPRAVVEIMATFRHDLTSCTVVLKDLTRFGARVEGIGPMETDEAVSLGLPGCRPALAFVAWSDGSGAGLEFADPLAPAIYADLVARYGLGSLTNPTLGRHFLN